MRKFIAPLGALLAAVGIGLAAAPAGAAVHSTGWITATTTLTNRPDSGVQGNNWASDNYTRVASIKLVGQVANGNCPVTSTGDCYLWDFRLTDTGTSTTIAGQDAPRTGTLDQALTVTMTGGTNDGQFYSSWKTAKASRVPTTENDNNVVPTGRHTTTNWVEQFFGGADFNSTANPGGPDLGVNAGWTYTGNFGFDPACPNDAYKWIDAAASSWGSTNADGNILTPNAADCS